MSEKLNCNLYVAEVALQLQISLNTRKLLLNRNFLCRKFQNLSRIFMHPENPTNKPHTLVCGKQEGFLDTREQEFRKQLLPLHKKFLLFFRPSILFLYLA